MSRSELFRRVINCSGGVGGLREESGNLFVNVGDFGFLLCEVLMGGGGWGADMCGCKWELCAQEEGAVGGAFAGAGGCEGVQAGDI